MHRYCRGMYTIGDSDLLLMSLLQEPSLEAQLCLLSFHASAV
jgi:hypothetical protein